MRCASEAGGATGVSERLFMAFRLGVAWEFKIAFAIAVGFALCFGQENNLGIKLGFNFPSMYYRDTRDTILDAYSSSVYEKGTLELFGEYMIIHSLSIRPGLKFITRGQYINESGFTYEFNANYIDLNLPIAYTFQAFKSVYPYVLAGPVLGVALGGDIRYEEDGDISYKTKINKSNLRPYSIGLYLGAGVKYSLSIKEFIVVPGFEAGYHLGLTNTYSKKELHGTAEALNASNYKIDGSREHRGLELGVTLSIPLGNFKKSKSPKPEPKPKPESVPEKSCYTFDEIKELIHAEQDIHGKKICAIKKVNFEFGNSKLTDEDKIYLYDIVILMETNELIKIKVNGHTDNVGGHEFNMNLSHDRAKSVYDYLKSRGIDASRLSFTFFGSTHPIADNDTEEGRAINRRVEFEITNK